jgi:hypothetical protein
MDFKRDLRYLKIITIDKRQVLYYIFSVRSFSVV